MVERVRSKFNKANGTKPKVRKGPAPRLSKVLKTTSIVAPKKKRWQPPAPGEPLRAGPGRKKGGHNRLTKVLREAILLAAEAHGEDGEGKDALFGYCFRIARDDQRVFVRSLLSKVLPLQLTGLDGEPIKVLKIPPEQLTGMTVDELALLERVLGKLLPHQPKLIGSNSGNGAIIDHEAVDAQDYEDSLSE